ncbi:phage protein Gp13 family protein [Hyphomicrobium sp. ghe19]|uniref:phage protein Gp13 family protein n=1 Tax=Hyphomicrobium sp. ghe19 TaxID=2682968 RepID=UPI0030CA9023
MKPRTQIVPARPAHIRTIARRMREADRLEVHAASGKTPGQALAFSLRKSSVAWTWLVDGRPEAMFGVGDLNILAGVGAPWLLGTDVVLAHQMEFLRRSREWRNQLLQRYSTLTNFVDVRNEVSVRWLRWLGFKLSEPITYRGHDFYVFELRSTDV